MSTEMTPEEIQAENKKRLTLKEKLDKGIKPEVKAPVITELTNNKPKNTIPDFTLSDEDKTSLSKIAEKYEELTTYIVKKDVDTNRDKILTELETLDKEEFELQKENYSINELETSLRVARRNKPKITKRDVGATDGPPPTKEENTQWDTVNNKPIPG